jgi:hypothetical protein
MNTFILKLGRYLLYAFLAWGGVMLVCMVFAKFSPAPFVYAATQKPVQQTDILIFGNSRAESAINDKLLPIKFHNVANSGEALFYSTIKARSILEKYGNDTVIIEFTNNSLTTIKWVLDDDRLYTEYQESFTRMRWHEHVFLLRHKPAKTLKTMIAMSPLRILKTYRLVDGGYKKLTRHKLTNPDTANNQGKLQSQYEPATELANFIALRSLITDFPGTHFILTRTPLHSTYILRNEETYLQCARQLDQLPNCTFIDFNRLLPPLADSCFADIGHLNHTGAGIYTPVFLEMIRKPQSAN